MRIILFYFCALLFASLQTAVAQKNDELIKVGRDMNWHKYPAKGRFRFAAFSKGMIYDINKKTWPLDRMNYDFYQEKMLFINEVGDTIIIKDLSEFRYFEIGEITFVHIHHKGYFEILEGNDSLQLCVNEIYRIESFDNMGAFSVGDGTVLEKKHFYYLADKDENLMKADLHNFQQLFPAHRTEIKSFVKEHNTDFRIRDDLKTIFRYCLQLGDKKDIN